MHTHDINERGRGGRVTGGGEETYNASTAYLIYILYLEIYTTYANSC